MQCYGPIGCYKPKCVAMPLAEALWSAMGQNQVLLMLERDYARNREKAMDGEARRSQFENYTTLILRWDEV